MLVNMISLLIGVYTGMWIRNQLNEGKKPFHTIRDGIVKVGQFCRTQYQYCLKRIPKKDDTPDDHMGVGA